MLLLLDVYLATLSLLITCRHILLLLLDHARAIVNGPDKYIVWRWRTLINLRQLLGHVRLPCHTSRQRWSPANCACWRRTKPLLLFLIVYELGVQEHKALVHDLERARHRLVVIVELVEDVSSAALGQLNQQTLRRLHVVGCNKEVCVVRRYLHDVVSLPQLPPLLVKHNSILVQRLSLLDNCALALQCLLRIEGVVLAEA